MESIIKLVYLLVIICFASCTEDNTKDVDVLYELGELCGKESKFTSLYVDLNTGKLSRGGSVVEDPNIGTIMISYYGQKGIRKNGSWVENPRHPDSIELYTWNIPLLTGQLSNYRYTGSDNDYNARYIIACDGKSKLIELIKKGEFNKTINP